MPLLVSIHAPVKGATWLATFVGLAVGFNPRAREGRDAHAAGAGLHVEVSIHAPVKSATFLQRLWAEIEHVSIHAPVKSATCAQDRHNNNAEFQSTRP